MPMHGYPTPNSGGAPQPDNAVVAAGGGRLPSGKPGGDITISRREAQALIAFDTEDNHLQAMNRAKRETGLTSEQLTRLKGRAQAARNKGYTLKSERHVFKPTNYDGDDEGLLGKKELDSDTKGSKKVDAKGKTATKAAAKGKTTKAQAATAKPTMRETAALQERWTRVHECDGDNFCGPCRQRMREKVRARETKRRRASC